MLRLGTKVKIRANCSVTKIHHGYNGEMERLEGTEQVVQGQVTNGRQNGWALKGHQWTWHSHDLLPIESLPHLNIKEIIQEKTFDINNLDTEEK